MLILKAGLGDASTMKRLPPCPFMCSNNKLDVFSREWWRMSLQGGFALEGKRRV